MKTCGIYFIKSRINDKYYVGQSIWIEKRLNDHISLIKRKKHINVKLTNHVGKYDFHDLEFGVLMTLAPQELNTFEKFFIQCFDSYRNGFNMNLGGEDRPVKSRPAFVVKNIKTNQEYRGKSIKEFCNSFSLCETNICAVLQGRSQSYKGWYNPEKTKPKIYNVISPNGVKYEFWSIREFAKTHSLNENGLYYLASGKNDHHKGWTRPDSKNKYALANQRRKKAIG